MKIFISQPMAGKTKEEILEEQRKAYLFMSENYDEDIFIINSYFDGFKVMNPCYCLGTAIKKLAQCDVVVFCRGWENARGCRIEHACAEAYGYKMIFMDN